MMVDDKTRLLFVVSGHLSTKGSTQYLKYDLTKVFKTYKSVIGFFLLLLLLSLGCFCLFVCFFVQLSWAHLN